MGDIDAAVEATRRVYRTEWCDCGVRERADVLFELATIVENHREELVELETNENGKPLHESAADIDASVSGLRYYAGTADKHHRDTIPERNGIIDFTFYESYEVVGVIIPGNWPPMHICDFLTPALAIGNTVVLEPAPEMPLSALRLAELFDDAISQGVQRRDRRGSGIDPARRCR